MKPLNSRKAYRSSGFSLIEVMVALLVLLIGLLGVVRMQLFSVQNNQGAYLRTQATYIASDMMDRMRANREGRNINGVGGVVTDEYEDFLVDATSANPGENVPDDPACASSTDGCGPEELADMDKREIASHFYDVFQLGAGSYVPTMPQGSIEVLKNPDGASDGISDEYVVTVTWAEQTWDEDADGNAVRADSVRHSVQLRSVIRRIELFEDVPDPNSP